MAAEVGCRSTYNRDVKRWLAASIVAIALLGGCLREERTATPAARDESQPQRGGTLLRRLEADVVSVNPILATSRYDRLVADYLFTPLVSYDAEQHIIPALADSWTISADGREYMFRLNERATFSDGTPVLAGDVLFTLRKIVDPQ